MSVRPGTTSAGSGRRWGEDPKPRPSALVYDFSELEPKRHGFQTIGYTFTGGWFAESRRYVTSPGSRHSGGACGDLACAEPCFDVTPVRVSRASASDSAFSARSAMPRASRRRRPALKSSTARHSLPPLFIRGVLSLPNRSPPPGRSFNGRSSAPPRLPLRAPRTPATAIILRGIARSRPAIARFRRETA